MLRQASVAQGECDRMKSTSSGRQVRDKNGPISREGIAAALGESLTIDAAMVEEIAGYFQRRGQDMPAPNIKQAQLISSAQFLRNP
jgi:hypothetical protein